MQNIEEFLENREGVESDAFLKLLYGLEDDFIMIHDVCGDYEPVRGIVISAKEKIARIVEQLYGQKIDYTGSLDNMFAEIMTDVVLAVNEKGK